jgi:hypothetical protein
MRKMLKVMMHWFPERSFVFAGNSAQCSDDLVRAAARRRRPNRLTLISRFHPDANLYALPPKRTGRERGRPRKKRKNLPSSERAASSARVRDRLNVAWYKGSRRNVEVVTGTGHRYKTGEGLVAVLWLFVHD